MPTGAINLAPLEKQVAQYTPTTADAATPSTVGYQAKSFEVAPNQTVKGQVEGIIEDRGVAGLMNQARTRANQKANARGLINSSMAVGEGEQAVIAQALPIAQADAQTHATAATNTTNAVNAASYAKMQADNAAAMRASELRTNVSLANADARTKADAASADAANRVKLTGMETDRSLQLADKDTARALQLADKEFQRAIGTAQLDANTRIQLQSMDSNTRLSLANVDRNTRVELLAIEKNYGLMLQNNQDLATMYNQVSTNIANIAMSNLDAGAKVTATQSQLNILKETLNAKQNASTASATPSTTAPRLDGLGISNYFQDLNNLQSLGGGGTIGGLNSVTNPTGQPTYGQPGNVQPPSSGGSGGGSAGGSPPPSIPAGATPAPQYGAGAYTYWQSGSEFLFRPGVGATRIGGR